MYLLLKINFGIECFAFANLFNRDEEMREVIQDEEEEARRGVTQEDDDMEPQVLMEGMEGVDGDGVFLLS